MITLSACGDGSRRPRDDDESPASSDAAVDGAVSDASAASSDASTADASADAAGGPMDGGDGGVAPADGGVAPAADASTDASADAPDASAGDGGPSGDGGAATQPDASDAARDGSSGDDASALPDATTSDASAATDAATSDASTEPDAASDAGADASAPDASSCQVQDFRFGCGVVRGRFIEFTSGYTIDTQEGLVWGPVRNPLGDNEHDEGCGTPEFTLVDAFAFPNIDQVRTLSAGCADTSCELSTSCVGVGCSVDCQACTASQGPGAGGGYCHPELLTCVDLFTFDACDVGASADCSPHQHWYYEATTGAFKLVGADQRVSGRCVARIRGPLPAP